MYIPPPAVIWAGSKIVIRFVAVGVGFVLADASLRALSMVIASWMRDYFPVNPIKWADSKIRHRARRIRAYTVSRWAYHKSNAEQFISRRRSSEPVSLDTDD